MDGIGENLSLSEFIEKKIDTLSIHLEKHTLGGERDEKGQHRQWGQKKTLGFSNQTIVTGSLIGVTISGFVRWNAGRYNRVSSAFRMKRFTRNFILTNQKPVRISTFTNYYIPNLNTPMNNFMCFSGESGIGKSSHFQNMAYRNSGVRPSIYVSFKAAGNNQAFQEDLAEQVNYGSDCPGVLSEIIRAVKDIHRINLNPERLWAKIIATHCCFFGSTFWIYTGPLEASLGMFLFSVLGVSYTYYANFMVPFVIQSFRRTCPLVIFDDLSKIQSMNMFPQIVRYLQLLENGMANVILVSSDEGTWSRLRREPGMKDRLRLRHITYDHIFTAEKLIDHLEDEKNYDSFMEYVGGNKLYDREIVISLIKQLIGKRQVTLRRFISILKLNDEEEYEKLVQNLERYKTGLVSRPEAVRNFTDIMYDSEMETMVANLKNIKREMEDINEQNFLLSLQLLLRKGRLPSDNLLAPSLKAYNIVRDLRSEYVINGKFMYSVLTMATLEYQKDMKFFKQQNIKIDSIRLPADQFLKNSSQKEQKTADQVPIRKQPIQNTNKN